MSAELRAITVQAAILKELHGIPWFRGISSSVEGSTPIVTVRVKEITSEVLAAIPAQVGGAEVRLMVVGDIVAQT